MDILIKNDAQMALNFLELPEIVLEMIFSKLSYDEIARLRIVCKAFDHICKKLLNRGFNLMEKYHAQCLRTVKSQLPRRESERRTHPLARHCDILTAIETRISMLSMTFTKYIDLNLCCFIPGKVIDEILRVLRLIRLSKTPPRTPEILQELRDISSMAMEHFDEKILPDFKSSICHTVSANVSQYNDSLSHLMMPHHTSHPKSSTLPHNLHPSTWKKICNRTKKNKITILSVKGQIGKMKLRMNRQASQIRKQNVKLQEHTKKIQDQNHQLAEMKKHLEEWEQKLGDLTAELNRANSLDNCKRKTCDTGLLNSKDIQAKKRKLIVERKSSVDAQDVKFKKFMVDLLDKPMEECMSDSN
ncbi:F-box only protein 28 [Copidosoma floridanum]|uniref:F-box only protein 28 n=1 Tax=Copidosoma floridanum TaxID=29053 RepID=UPI0006C9C72E|nr:F-box only protein 28 [Copidosoma floridanum]